MSAVMDARRMNHMDSESKLIHLRLEAWGRWAKENHGAWPSESLIGRIMRQGAQGSSQSGSPPIAMPGDIARTDRAVAALGEVDKRVIVSYYSHWEPIEQLAKAMHVGVRQYQNILRRARWRLTLTLNSI